MKHQSNAKDVLESEKAFWEECWEASDMSLTYVPLAASTYLDIFIKAFSEFHNFYLVSILLK